MDAPCFTFADLLDPVTPEVFFAEYCGRRPLHVAGRPEKFAAVMSWAKLNELLNMTSIWSGTSLQVVLDREPVPPARYCRPGLDRNNVRVLQPDPTQVARLLRQGATLVANDVDCLAPGLAAVAGALETALAAKVQGNVYCSWAQRQGFNSHFDTHDVFALHVEGEKIWRIYEGRAEAPIAHPRFKSYGQDHHDRAKGRLLREVRLRPGDLLYLPRGQYHDALASTEGTIHIAFGATAVIGVDFLDLLRELAIEDPQFRENLPRPDPAAPKALAEHLERLAVRLAELGRAPEARERIQAFQAAYRFPRGGFDLPEGIRADGFKVRAKNLKILKSDGLYKLSGPKGQVPIPPGAESLVVWVLEREAFSPEELAAAFPGTGAEQRSRLLRDLAAMKVIEPL